MTPTFVAGSGGWIVCLGVVAFCAMPGPLAIGQRDAAGTVTAAAPRSNAWDRWEQRQKRSSSASGVATPQPSAPTQATANYYVSPSTASNSVRTVEPETRVAPMLQTELAAPARLASVPNVSSGWSTPRAATLRVPGLSSPTSAQFLAQFTTDYKRRPAWLECPPTICGPGINGQNLPIGQEDAYRGSLPANYMPTDLVMLPRERCYGDMILYLRREPAEALMRMLQDAERQGLHFEIFSAFRDSKHQTRLYGEASRRSGGGKPSTVARPGKSEHMLGTTVDLTNDSRSMMSKSFANTREGRWLLANARRYGFVHTCVRQVGKRTEIFEPWHIRYFGSAANTARTGQAEPELDTTQPENVAHGSGQKRGLVSQTASTLTRPFRR